MRVFKPDNVGLLYRGYLWDNKPLFSVAAVGLFSLVGEEADHNILPESELWPAIEAGVGKKAVFDEGWPKQRGEYLVYGAACSSQPVEMLKALVKLGSLTKQVVAFGDHYWKEKDTGIPKMVPFTRMPITWEKAFGGPEYKLNPVGTGMVRDDKGWILAPNVQDIDHLIDSIKERPEPVGLNAIPAEWLPRSKHLGEFNKDWLIDRWPYFPAGTNPEHFNSAPENQRARSYFKGDEPIEIHNMNPDHPVIESKLPGVRARIFVVQTAESEESFIEVSSHLETVWLFPELGRGVVLFRGAIPVADDDYDDLTYLTAHFEPLPESPKPKEYYQQWLMSQTAPAEEVKPEEAAEEQPAPPSEEPAAPPPEAPPLAEIEALMAEIAGLAAAAEKELAKIGMTPEEALAKYAPPPAAPEPAASPGELKQVLEELEKQTQQIIKEHNIDPARLEQLTKQSAGPGQPAIENLMAEWKKSATFDPKLGAEVDQALAGLSKVEAEAEAIGTGGAAQAAAGEAAEEAPTQAAPPAGLAEITAEEVLARHQRGESLAGLDLTGLDLTGADLKGADLKGAVLDSVKLEKANLSGADMSGARLTEADLPGADLTQAILNGVSANNSRFTQANLQGADLSEGDFTAADFVEADFRGATLTRAIFDLAVMNRIDAREAKAEGAEFYRAVLSQANFIGADLTGADLTGARIVQTNFDGIHAKNLKLHGVSGKRASFLASDLRESRAGDGALLAAANLAGADLTGADWGGTDLTRANLSETILTKADFSKAVLHGADIRCASARGASFIKAELNQARMEGIDLLDGSLRKADLRQVNLSQANLFAVDMYKVRLGGHHFEGTNLGRTVLEMKGLL